MLMSKQQARWEKLMDSFTQLRTRSLRDPCIHSAFSVMTEQKGKKKG